MIEVGSPAEVEATLRRAGFFEGGGDGLAADVYLGYRLSQDLRRQPGPPPPELCPLPAAAACIRQVTDCYKLGGPFRVGEWERIGSSLREAATQR